MATKTMGFGELNAKLDKAIGVMVAKKDLEDLATRHDIKNLGKGINELELKWEDRFKMIIEILDKQTKILVDIQMEVNGMKMQLARHERWIQEIAEKTGINLKY